MMLASLLEMTVHMIIALLAVKLVYFKKSDNKPAQNVSMKAAVDTMGIMETRLNQLQERDLKLQERVWFLEDQNRDLQDRLSRATKDLLMVRPSHRPSTHIDDDDDHDAQHSIPTN